MCKQQKLMGLFFASLLLAGLACTPMQRIFPGDIAGESTDGEHSQWVDESGADAGVGIAPDAEVNPDVAGESMESAVLPADVSLDPSLQDTSLAHAVESRSISFELIESNGGGTQGQILKVTISNTGQEDLTIEIPAGLVFTPDDSGEQDMMVLDAEIVDIQAGETIVFSPYVVCIDAGASAPATGSGYQVGYLAEGDLLDFAVCVDQQADDPLDAEDIGLQFAVWSIAGGGDIFDTSALSEQEEGALSGMIEEWESMSGMMEAMQTLGSQMSADWLQRCGINFEPGE